jgi:hypothetical protein
MVRIDERADSRYMVDHAPDAGELPCKIDTPFQRNIHDTHRTYSTRIQ